MGWSLKLNVHANRARTALATVQLPYMEHSGQRSRAMAIAKFHCTLVCKRTLSGYPVYKAICTPFVGDKLTLEQKNMEQP